jgi:hypothetical protein
MSTKSTIFLTNDNEHCYSEGSEPNFKDGKFIGNSIVMELDKSNIDIHEDKESVIITFKNPSSDIYKQINSIPKWYMGKNEINP